MQVYLWKTFETEMAWSISDAQILNLIFKIQIQFLGCLRIWIRREYTVSWQRNVPRPKINDFHSIYVPTHADIKPSGQ